MSRDVFLRLQDMREGIAAAYRLTEGLDRAALEGDEPRYAACQYRILNVAEAANHLPKALTDGFPEVAWRELIDMGHMLRHQYVRIEADVVWNTVHVEFPKLLAVVERMFEEVAMAGVE